MRQISELNDNYPTIINVEAKTEKVVPGKDLLIKSKISGENLNKVVLHYRFGEASFSEIAMFDDGINDDGADNDMIFGAKISIPDTIKEENIDYYVTAENTLGRITFYPARAEFEFLTVKITFPNSNNDIVINEFMADNSSTIQDPQGKYEDWIELFNKSNQDISLNGWYLTDDATKPNKWQFHDISIKAGDYLLIWADEDLLDEGLHADIKLSKSGEFIGLYDKDLNLIDSYSFGAQSSDVSEARIPNGTGDFVKSKIPTPNSENKVESSVILFTEKILVRPNPANEYIEINWEKSPKSQSSFSPFDKGGSEFASRGISEIKIFNTFGEIVITDVKHLGDVGHLKRIEISHLPLGIYFIQIGNYLEKFVVVR